MNPLSSINILRGPIGQDWKYALEINSWCEVKGIRGVVIGILYRKYSTTYFHVVLLMEDGTFAIHSVGGPTVKPLGRVEDTPAELTPNDLDIVLTLCSEFAALVDQPVQVLEETLPPVRLSRTGIAPIAHVVRCGLCQILVVCLLCIPRDGQSVVTTSGLRHKLFITKVRKMLSTDTVRSCPFTDAPHHSRQGDKVEEGFVFGCALCCCTTCHVGQVAAQGDEH
jgi:hypothetical protein